MLSIGLMSGTSMDGIDAALLETDGTAKHIRELGHIAIEYTKAFILLLKATEYAIKKYQGDINQARENLSIALNEYLTCQYKVADFDLSNYLTDLKTYLSAQGHAEMTFDAVIEHSTDLHAVAVKKLLEETGNSATDIDVVGYHGQTMYHQPDQKISIILGDGQRLADTVQIKVVNDFRRNDIEHGGQGAPFAPLYHQALACRDGCVPLVVVNCGGIANVTIIDSDEPEELIGFDTGPGNGLLDQFVKQRTQGRESMDHNGEHGRAGKVDKAILEQLYNAAIQKSGENYFLKSPPKSLDYGDLILIPELDQLSLADGCATLAAFTADSIIRAVGLVKDKYPRQWILAGGGWNNPNIRQQLITRLQQQLGDDIQVSTANEAGWNSQALEAQIFAYFAVRSLEGKPLSVPGTTGVKNAVSGGCLYEPK